MLPGVIILPIWGESNNTNNTGNFEGFPLSYCIVWVGNIMIPEWYQGCISSPPPTKTTLVASSNPTQEPDLFGRALHVAKGPKFGRKVDKRGHVCVPNGGSCCCCCGGESEGGGWCSLLVELYLWFWMILVYQNWRLSLGPLSCATCYVRQYFINQVLWIWQAFKGSEGQCVESIFQLIGTTHRVSFDGIWWYMYLHLPSFTTKINQMQVNIPYVNPMGCIYIIYIYIHTYIDNITV